MTRRSTRTLKPQKVDQVSHPKSRAFADIMLDRNQLDFFAVIGTQKVRAPTAEACKALALEKLNEVVTFVWEPVILIQHEKPSEGGGHWMSHRSEYKQCNVEFKFRRTERSPSPDGKGFMERPHLANVKSKYDLQQRADLKDVEKLYEGEDTVILPYSDLAWDGLLRLQQTILRANHQLDVLLKEDVGVKLAKMGAGYKPPQLPAKSEDDEDD